jgi:TolB-like protein/Flp pilus assembly protein TadD
VSRLVAEPLPGPENLSRRQAAQSDLSRFSVLCAPIGEKRSVPTERVERRLAAILAADVAGYSRLTGVDEEGTHLRLQHHLGTLIHPKIAEHGGRVVKNTGDGLLAEFGSVVEAVRCAVDIQRGMRERNTGVPPEKRIEFRIGINLGDIISDRGDIYGDGVNVAARLQIIADPGGICVSEDAHRQVRGKLDVGFEDTGEQQLKNIDHAVRVYRLRRGDTSSGSRTALPVPDKPSIAVLPFQNFSGDPEQEYFADGMVEDITMALSRFGWLFVIARNSSFTYKGRAVDVKQVGRELGVRYVMEGSVRKTLNRLRIAAQLIDAATGRHLWADRFEGGLEDLFDLQDQVTAKVVTVIAPKLERAEIERAKAKPTESLDACDYYLRARAAHRWTREANDETLRLLHKAMELDADFASAYGMAAWCYVQRKARGWMLNNPNELVEAERLIGRALKFGKEDALALCLGGYALAYILGDLAGGRAFINRALMLNPNLATARSCDGWVSIWLGETERAFEHLSQAKRLNPLDPSLFVMKGAVAFAHILDGRYEAALSSAEASSREQPDFLLSVIAAAASAALAGRLDKAHRAVEHLRGLNPGLRISNLEHLTPFRRPEDLARLADGLRKAGVPE